MSDVQTDVVTAFRRAYGKVAPPDKITQEVFEGSDAHLRRLVRLKADERPKPEDLREYIHDLRYTEIQATLLSYLLPFCLELWRQDVLGVEGYGGIIEDFYPVLADREIFDRHLTSKQCAAASQFIRGTILEEIDNQSGLFFQGGRTRSYRWVRALTTYGVLLPDIELLWSAWWSLNTVGRAVAAVQYISCLMYPENENPVFAPWTPNGGGGPPVLWDFEGHLYTHRWLEPNVTFLKRFLSMSSVRDVLDRAVHHLTAQPEHDVATQIQADLPLLTEILEARCAELPRLLETTQEPSKLFTWSR